MGRCPICGGEPLDADTESKGRKKLNTAIIMREIKFRGKSKRDGRWWFGNLVVKDTRGNTQINDPENGGCFEIDPDTVGQFTGLHDKNGKDIYEGDIVKTDVSRANATKNKHYRNFAIRYNAPHFWNGFDSLLMVSGWRMEVIGNIYDNPELLKED